MKSLMRAAIAGFDGDGCLLAQLIRRKDYRYGFQGLPATSKYLFLSKNKTPLVSALVKEKIAIWYST